MKFYLGIELDVSYVRCKLRDVPTYGDGATAISFLRFYTQKVNFVHNYCNSSSIYIRNIHKVAALSVDHFDASFAKIDRILTKLCPKR